MQTMSDRSTTSTAERTMQAITQQAYGEPEVLELSSIARPVIGADEVLIEVEAAGLDRGVWHLMTGMPYLIRIMGYGLTGPKNPVPGMDVAGRVVEIGAEVTRFAVGDEVFGIGNGTFAEFAAAKESKLAHKPESVSFEDAAVSAISGITALQALTTVGRVESGQRVLVVGASGGVGSFAVQLATALGAGVTGVASTAKLDAVRAMGADDVIDYTHQNIDDGGQRFDLIIDTGGRNPVSRLRRALAPTGTLVIVGGEGGDRLTGGIGRQLRAAAISPFVSQRLAFFMSSESAEDIATLAGHLAAGDVVPVIGQRCTLDEVPAAIEAMQAGTLTGKTLITVTSSMHPRPLGQLTMPTPYSADTGEPTVHDDQRHNPSATALPRPDRREGRLFGALVLAAFLLYGIGSSIAATPTGITLVALNSIAVAIVGVLGFRLLGSEHQGVAAGYLGARVAEAALLLVGIVLFQFADLGDAERVGYQLAMLVLGVGSVPFFHATGRLRLLPSWFARWGVFGYSALAAGAALELTTGRPVAILLAIPGGLFEVALGVYLVRRGFGSSK